MGEMYDRLQTFPYAELSVDKIRLEAAQRAFSRLMANGVEYGDYTDPVSGVTLRQLLGLLWLASHDKSLINDPLECEKLYIEGLYECQLGKNAYKKTADGQPRPDCQICASGSLNKLLEKFSKVHQLINVIAVTFATAGKKLVRVAKQETINYLKSLSPSQFDSVGKLALSGDTSDIWTHIKEKVTAEILSEFGPYLNKIRLMDVIEQCEYMTFNEEVESIRKQRTETPSLGAYVASNYPQGYLASDPLLQRPRILLSQL